MDFKEEEEIRLLDFESREREEGYCSGFFLLNVVVVFSVDTSDRKNEKEDLKFFEEENLTTINKPNSYMAHIHLTVLYSFDGAFFFSFSSSTHHKTQSHHDEKERKKKREPVQ